MTTSAARAQIGFHCSHEQHSPSALLRFVRAAEQAGFDAAMCSDHFHPWLDQECHSGFAWSWLAAALETTSLPMGTVNAPGQRYHPAVIAQAAATLEEMYPRRLFVAIGSGEALNESITGDEWPDKGARNARLRECADIMRALWAGETVSHDGLVKVRDARLHSRPAQPPLLVGAALSAETAKWMAPWVDGLITVGGEREAMREVLSAFRDNGGARKPVFLQVALSFASSQAEAEEAAFREWPQVALTGDELADLPTPQAFAAACRRVTRADVTSQIRCSADISRHAAWVQEDLAMGYQAVFLHNVASAYGDQFIDAMAGQLPQIR